MPEENEESLPQPRTGQKPNYLQQEVIDKAIEDGERRLMERIQKDKQEKG